MRFNYIIHCPSLSFNQTNSEMCKIKSTSKILSLIQPPKTSYTVAIAMAVQIAFPIDEVIKRAEFPLWLARDATRPSAVLREEAEGNGPPPSRRFIIYACTVHHTHAKMRTWGSFVLGKMRRN